MQGKQFREQWKNAKLNITDILYIEFSAYGNQWLLAITVFISDVLHIAIVYSMKITALADCCVCGAYSRFLVPVTS